MSLLAIPGVELRGVEKSIENFVRLKVVEGVVEKRKDPPLPFVTGAMFPNCLAGVLNGLGGLSVPFRGPGKMSTIAFMDWRKHVSLWESQRECCLRVKDQMTSILASTFVDLSIHSPWETLLSVPRQRISMSHLETTSVIYIAGHHCERSETGLFDSC
jgi:hypothetical protein